LSKQFTVVTTVIVGSILTNSFPKYLISYCPGLAIISDVLLCSPLIATSLGKHDTVELAIPRGYDSRCAIILNNN